MIKSSFESKLLSTIFIFLMFLGSVARADLNEFRSALLAEGLTPQQAAQVIAKLDRPYPQATVSSKVAWLRDQGVRDIGKVLGLLPSILSLSIAENLDPKVEWLRSQGVRDIGKVLNSLPAILGYSISENLNPKVHWLRAQGVQDIGKLLTSYPQILSFSISENLSPKLDWLKIHGVKNPGYLMNQFPAIFGYSIIENFVPKRDWLRAQGVQDIGPFFTTFPQIFGLSISENLQPTVDEFYHYWGLSVDDIENRPMVLGASLTRVVELRQFLDRWAQVAGAPQFDLMQFPKSKRMSMIQGVGVAGVIENLKAVGAIRTEVQSFSDLNNKELNVLKRLYQTGQINGLLVRPPKLANGIRGSVTAFCQSLLSGGSDE